MASEEWRPVVGWEGLYEVSSHGRVRSLDRKITRTDGRAVLYRGRLRSLSSRGDGHLSVDLKRAGKRVTYLVHRLVALAFIPNPEAHPQVRHWNDVPDDNRTENLLWGTNSDNLHDRVRNGKHHSSNKTHCKRGHEFNEENTRPNTGGKNRSCAQCRKERYGVAEPPQHGTYSGYVSFGCRCRECKQAGREYRARRKERVHE